MTLLLKLTNLIQILNVLFFALLGFLLTIIISIVSEAFIAALTFGAASGSSSVSFANPIVIICLGFSLFYLLDTIGLAMKKQIARFLSILVNLAIVVLIGYEIYDQQPTGNDLYSFIVFGIVYLIPVLTLTIHRPTVRLFKK